MATTEAWRPGESESTLVVEEQTQAAATPESPHAAAGLGKVFTRNAALGVSRLLVTSLVALILPAYLAHKLPVQTYSAWVLILQMSAYVAYLDFGVQTGVAKYVAEYEARGDANGANIRASAGLLIMLAASVVGVLLTLVLAWFVPQVFHAMPASLYPQVRTSLLFVGVSLSFGLFCSVFSAIFVGLQRYELPVAISVINRLLFTGVVCGAVALHSNLAAMGAAVGGVNILTGVLQIVAWRKLAARIQLSLRQVDRPALRQMLAYCSVLAIWSAGMLCVSGLDLTFVGKYDFGETAFYAIAVLPTTFILSILAAALGPLMPSASALSTQRTPAAMGDLLARATRYSTLVLLVSGLPLLVAAYPVLRLWVGPAYALHAMPYLRVLMVASILRNLGAPYATMLVAMESQRIAVAGAIAEAVVNLAASLYLVQHLGAVGVALGTLIGSFVSIGMHFTVNMHRTHAKLAIGRMRLLVVGVLRPGLVALPSVALTRFWWIASAPRLNVSLWVGWGMSTLLLAWFTGLDPGERHQLIVWARRRLRRPQPSVAA